MRFSLSRRSFVSGASALLLSHRAGFSQLADRPLATPAALTTPYKLGRLVLGGSKLSGEFDEKSVDCPFVFRGEDRFYLTFVGYDGTGYETGLASSNDLIHWKREGCILHRDPQSNVTRYNIAMTWILRANDIASPGKLIKVDGRYLGAWHAYPNAGYEAGPAVIGLCWSRDLLHWEVDPPCMHPADADTGTWEQGGLYKPCIVRQDGMYYIFYNAKTRPTDVNGRVNWFEQTGVAMSRDLKKWKRYSGNPIIRNGAGDAWDSHFASDPCVLKYKNEWAFFYFSLSNKDGKARELLAVSKDMTSPIKTNSILIDPGPPGTVDDDYAHKPSLITHEGVLYHFYCAVSGKWPKDIRGISLARSKPWSI
jgi:predicted GH43/DUF377 family glycosyl hydrolase